MSSERGRAPILFLVTGSRGAGKTTFCQSLVTAAQGAGWKTSGILSLPVYEDRRRVAIDALDLSSGEKRRLADRIEDEEEPQSTGPRTKHWQFSPPALAWGSQVLQASTPTDLLVVDELGPLEFEQERGWLAGIQAAASMRYAVGLVVVRSEFLGEALLRLPELHIIEIDTPEDSAYKAGVLKTQLF